MNAMKLLIWKDFRLVLSLALFVIGAIILMNLISLMLGMTGQIRPADMVDGSQVALMVSLAIVGLGAPLMLIANEHESGATAWLRGLPIGPNKWIGSKLIVSGLLVVMTCLLAWSGILLMNLLVVSGFGISFPRNARDIGMEAFFASLMIPMALLICGFVVTQIIRQPIASVFACIVAFFGSTICLGLAAQAIALSVSRMADSVFDPSYTDTFTLGVMCVFLGTIFVGVIASIFLLARRHPDDRFLARFSTVLKVEVDEATMVGSFAHRTGLSPSPIAAMFWQNMRSVGWIYLMIIFFGVGGIALISALTGELPFDYVLFLSCMMVGWIGGTTLFGDASHSSHRFFADRGISRLPLFASRFAPSLVGFFLMTFAIGLIGSLFDDGFFSETSFGPVSRPDGVLPFASGALLASYATSVLMPLLTPRATLGFLAAPFCGLLVMVCWVFNDLMWATPLLYLVSASSIAVAWLCFRKFLDGDRDWRYSGGLTVYLIAVLAVPFLL